MEWMELALRLFVCLAAGAATVLVCYQSARGERQPKDEFRRSETLKSALLSEEAEDVEIDLLPDLAP